MLFKIDKKIIEQATLCRKRFSCLQNDGEEICRVKQCVDDKVMFIECDNDFYCSYLKSFGESKYCNCPVRKEIFNTYGV